MNEVHLTTCRRYRREKEEEFVDLRNEMEEELAVLWSGKEEAYKKLTGCLGGKNMHEIADRMSFDFILDC